MTNQTWKWLMSIVLPRKLMPPLKNVQELQEVPFLSQNNDRVNESQNWAFACGRLLRLASILCGTCTFKKVIWQICSNQPEKSAPECRYLGSAQMETVTISGIKCEQCRFSVSPHFAGLCPEQWGLSENIQNGQTRKWVVHPLKLIKSKNPFEFLQSNPQTLPEWVLQKHVL